jgi:hypothetical protein
VFKCGLCGEQERNTAVLRLILHIHAYLMLLCAQHNSLFTIQNYSLQILCTLNHPDAQ